MKIGRKIYYDQATGEVIQDTGEREGCIVETTRDQDFASCAALSERMSETVGLLQLDYGQYAQDFAMAEGYKVDVSSEGFSLLFSYPNSEADHKSRPSTDLLSSNR